MDMRTATCGLARREPLARRVLRAALSDWWRQRDGITGRVGAAHGRVNEPQLKTRRGKNGVARCAEGGMDSFGVKGYDGSLVKRAVASAIGESLRLTHCLATTPKGSANAKVPSLSKLHSCLEAC
eukprot:5713513-Pleurochrysis_carterae.AAC.1